MAVEADGDEEGGSDAYLHAKSSVAHKLDDLELGLWLCKRQLLSSLLLQYSRKLQQYQSKLGSQANAHARAHARMYARMYARRAHTMPAHARVPTRARTQTHGSSHPHARTRTHTRAHTHREAPKARRNSSC